MTWHSNQELCPNEPESHKLKKNSVAFNFILPSKESMEGTNQDNSHGICGYQPNEIKIKSWQIKSWFSFFIQFLIKFKHFQPLPNMILITKWIYIYFSTVNFITCIHLHVCLFICICLDTHIQQDDCEDQRTTFRCLLCPVTMWTLAINSGHQGDIKCLYPLSHHIPQQLQNFQEDDY